MTKQSKQIAVLELPKKSIKETIQNKYLDLSWKDIERVFLYGQGLSDNSYRSYLESTKLFALFIGEARGNLFAVTTADLEFWYDYLVKKNDMDTARLRISGVKSFFKMVEQKVRADDINYVSPFENISEKLKEKLFASKKRDEPLPPLSGDEAKNLLAWLKADQGSLIAKQNYAIVYMLLTSGLRSSAMLSLKWDSLDRRSKPGKIFAYFQGKGAMGEFATKRELYSPAVKVTESVYRETTGLDPVGNCFLFQNSGKDLKGGKRSDPTPLKYQALYERIKRIGRHALKAGIITQSPNFTFSPHIFRRTFGTELHNNGMPLASVSRCLGHKNLSTTTKHYVSGEKSPEVYLQKMYT